MKYFPLFIFLLIFGCDPAEQPAEKTDTATQPDSPAKTANVKAPEAKRPANGLYQEFYSSGKLRGEEMYKDSALQWEKHYYESGILQTESGPSDTLIGKERAEFYRKAYYEDGKLQFVEYSENGQNIFQRKYFPNGKLAFESKGRIGWYNGAEHTAEYAEDGQLLHELWEEDLDPLPGDGGEFNNPRVYHEKYFSGGKLKATGDLYAPCGECDHDSAGTWKFYDNGKVVQELKFPVWQTIYRQDCEAARKADIAK